MVKKVILILSIILMIMCSTISSYATVPNNTGYKLAEVSFEEIEVKAANDTSRASMSINRIIGATITLVQIIARLIAVIIIIVAVVKTVKVNIEKDKIEKSVDVDQEKVEEIKNKIEKTKRDNIIRIVFALAFMVAAGILSVTKTLKPIIYIYPETDNMNVSVTLSNPDKITCSYPKYDNGWDVVVNKDGTIKEQGKERSYYSLYWEGLIHKKDFKDGFVVKGEDTAAFLEEKLELLGLNEKEAEEFIIYWLPKMEKNNYNLIRFLEDDEYNEEMELIVDPKPDTLIRVQMQFKPLLFKKDIPEQKLGKVDRKGYTVVEWGASEVR